MYEVQKIKPYNYDLDPLYHLIPFTVKYGRIWLNNPYRSFFGFLVTDFKACRALRTVNLDVYLANEYRVQPLKIDWQGQLRTLILSEVPSSAAEDTIIVILTWAYARSIPDEKVWRLLAPHRRKEILVNLQIEGPTPPRWYSGKVKGKAQ